MYRHVVIVGPSGAGKSTLCRRVVDEWRRRGLPGAGVMAELRHDTPDARGLDVVDVATGRRLPLAEFDRATGGPNTGRWHFRQDTFAAGLAWCETVSHDTLFVVDEVGPLELEQGLGWALLVPRVATHQGPALVAVRPALADVLLAALSPRLAFRVDLTPETRDAAVAAVRVALGLDA
ncbi:MAG: nucleoside-triphosphatase [Vicinamibacterales bacterium]|nr:nucleoside-triphosphatase [Vicinamibacterales bacterium]